MTASILPLGWKQITFYRREFALSQSTWVRHEILRRAGLFFLTIRMYILYIANIYTIYSISSQLPCSKLSLFSLFFFREVLSHKIYRNVEQRNRDFKSYKCKFVFADGEPIKLPENLESLPKADHFPTQRHRWNTNEVSQKNINSRKCKWNLVFESEFSCAPYKALPLVVSLYLM